MVSLLKKVRKKTFKKSNDIFSYPFRYISTMITTLLINTKITPLQVTWTHLIIGLMAAFLFSFGGNVLTIVAVLLFILAYILDLVDGELARYKKIRSEVSIWLDHVGDYILLFFVLAGIVIGNFRFSQDGLILILSLIALTLIASVGVITISKKTDRIKKIKAIILPFKFKFSKRLHLGIFTISFLLFIIGALTQKVKIMLIFYIIITFFAMIRAFFHRLNFIKEEFNE
jgi:phosphatidylglycerophosphate synthase